jgi:hypothetical protein
MFRNISILFYIYNDGGGTQEFLLLRDEYERQVEELEALLSNEKDERETEATAHAQELIKQKNELEQEFNEKKEELGREWMEEKKKLTGTILAAEEEGKEKLMEKEKEYQEEIEEKEKEMVRVKKEGESTTLFYFILFILYLFFFLDLLRKQKEESEAVLQQVIKNKEDEIARLRDKHELEMEDLEKRYEEKFLFFFFFLVVFLLMFYICDFLKNIFALTFFFRLHAAEEEREQAKREYAEKVAELESRIKKIKQESTQRLEDAEKKYKTELTVQGNQATNGIMQQEKEWREKLEKIVDDNNKELASRRDEFEREKMQLKG